jgi:hypothetical protein
MPVNCDGLMPNARQISPDSLTLRDPVVEQPQDAHVRLGEPERVEARPLDHFLRHGGVDRRAAGSARLLAEVKSWSAVPGVRRPYLASVSAAASLMVYSRRFAEPMMICVISASVYGSSSTWTRNRLSNGWLNMPGSVVAPTAAKGQVRTSLAFITYSMPLTSSTFLRIRLCGKRQSSRSGNTHSWSIDCRPFATPSWWISSMKIVDG